MNLYTALLNVTFCVKIGFLITVFYLKYITHTDPKNVKLQLTLSTAKGQFDFVFILLMSTILIINFNPYVEVIRIDRETKLLFFLYGVIMILTANYTNFENKSIFLHDTTINHDLSFNTFSLFNTNGNLQTFNRGAH